MKKRVVVTGIGLISPVGLTTEENWNGIMERKCVAGKVTSFPIGDMPCQIAYEIQDFELPAQLKNHLPTNAANRFNKFGLVAAAEALAQAGLTENNHSELAIVLGTGMGSPSFNTYCETWADQNFDAESVMESHGNRPEQLAHIIKRMTGASQAVKTVHTACASSGQSLGEAFEMIAAGEEKMILTGGADSMVNPFHMAGFCLLGALSQRNDDPQTASRPFDSERNGFVLGEGAAMLVFEEYDHAVQRGAKIIGEVCGYGVSESAYRITDLHPEGRGPIEAMQMAVKSAGLKESDIGYVNAHGTSTLLNDRIEALAVNKVFGENVYVSSTKSMTGHTISAAGALEFALTLLSVTRQTLLPSHNIFEQDPQCAIKLTGPQPEKCELRYGLSNSVGFGGSNTALIAGRI